MVMKMCGFDPIKECTDECKYWETCTRNPYKIWEQEYVGGRKHMGINEYQKLAARTINQKLSADMKEMHALHGMVGEIGELHSLYQKFYQGHVLDREHVKKELGDLLWFIAEYCTAMEWKLEDIMQLNIDKLKARYPEGFEVDRSLNRAEGDI